MNPLPATMFALLLAASSSDEVLHARLLDLSRHDQQVMQLPEAERERELRLQVDALRALVARGGWPTISRVGVDGARAAWQVVQHADFDPQFQGAALAQLRELLAIGEANADNVAHLEDRVAHARGRPQLYGTQGACQGGVWKPFQLREDARVDLRRKVAGLEPLSDYVARASRVMCGGAS